MFYHVSVCAVLLQYLCFTHYWRFSLGRRPIVIYPITNSNCTCQIDVNEKFFQSLSFPVFVNAINDRLIYPAPDSNLISVPTGEKLRFVCAGLDSMALSDDLGEVKVTGPVSYASCIYGSKWQFDDMHKFEADFRSLDCKGKIKSWAQLTASNCADKSREVEIGFRLESGKFLRILVVCFNYVIKHPNYSHSMISKGIPETVKYPVSFRRTYSTEFFRLYTSFIDMYQRGNIRISINKQLGMDKVDLKYVGEQGDYNLVCTQLISDVNFLYAFEKRATLYYINSFPMWKNNQTRGWEMLEHMCRKYSATVGADLEIFAGTWGFMKLPHYKSRECTPLYLHYTDNKGIIPIPQLIYRIAIDLKNDAGVVIVVQNNPFNQCLEKIIICEDISEGLEWFEEVRNAFRPSKVIACTVDSFKDIIWQLPVYAVNKILTLPSVTETSYLGEQHHSNKTFTYGGL